MHRSPLRGFSTEFAMHRPYVAGDTLRHLDWRVYGRTQRYYVKLFEAETNLTAHLLLDASASMRYASASLSKLVYASYLAASLAYLIVEQRDSVGLGVFDDRLRAYIEPKSTLGVIQHIAEELEKVDSQPRTNIAALLHEFARRIPRRGYVILFSDLFDRVDEVLKGLDHLRFHGHNVAVFHLLDPSEIHFPLDGVWKFKGLEGEGEIVTQPRRVRSVYLQELGQFLQEIRSGCERSRVEYVFADTSKPVENALIGFLASQIHPPRGT